ncbi:MAG: ATP-binding protein [Legionellales bacterium]|jgi:hypothetical protein
MYININELKSELQRTSWTLQLLTDLPPLFDQIGESSKIVSFASALHWLYQSDPSQHPYPPFPTKRDAHKIMGPNVQLQSVRHTAKKHGSKVGEIYDMREFTKLAQEYGYENNISYLKCITVNDFETHIINAVQNNDLLTVFFDADDKGSPGKFNGVREHSALVLGYAKNQKNEISLILQHWGQYYLEDINAVFESSQNLQDKRNPEVFIKKNKKWQTLIEEVEDHQYSTRHAQPPANDAISMRSALLVQRSTHRKETKSFYDTFNNALVPKIIDYQNSSLDHFKQSPAADIPLDILIHFLEIDNMRSDCYQTADLILFANNPELLKEKIIELTIEQYNTSLRGSLCDDIIRQNPDSKRSIIELISNSIDAKSNNIRVEITDGKYTIEDDGDGMDIEIIFRSLLVPKNSTKNKIEDSIGRFGLGFFTSLSHVLKDPNGSVTLETKSQNKAGYILKFKNINKNIFISIEESTKNNHGTTITVVDNNIEASLYESYAKQYMNCNQHVGLMINGTTILIEEDYRQYDLGLSKVYIRKTQTNRCYISLANILISEFETFNTENHLDIILSLPKNATLMESRDKILIDSEAMLAEVCKIIDLCHQLADDEKIPYLNSLAPAVYLFQRHNVFISNDSNLLEHLSHVLKKYLSILGKIPIPDNYLKKIFSNDDTQVVHHQILPIDWKMRIGEHCSLFESKTHDVMIAKLHPSRKIYHDYPNQILYIDQSFYDKIVREKRYVQANIITTEIFNIPGVWYDFRRISAQLESLVKFDVNYKKPKYHELFLKHGCLSYLSDEFLDSIPKNDMEILVQCPTLLKTFRKVDFPFDIHQNQKIYRILHENKVYYVLYDYSFYANDDSRYTFFDEHFQYVSAEKCIPLQQHALHQLSNIADKEKYGTEIFHHNNDTYYINIPKEKNINALITSKQNQQVQFRDIMLSKDKLIAFVENDKVYLVNDQNISVYHGKLISKYISSWDAQSASVDSWVQSFIYDNNDKHYFVTQDGRCWHYPTLCAQSRYIDSNNYYCIFEKDAQYIVVDKHGQHTVYESARLSNNKQDNCIIINNENLYLENKCIYSKKGIYNFKVHMHLKMIEITGKANFCDLVGLDGKSIFKEGQIKSFDSSDEDKTYISGALEINNQKRYFHITDNGVIWQEDPGLFFSNEGYAVYPYKFPLSEGKQYMRSDLKDYIVTNRSGMYKYDGGYEKYPILKILEAWQLKNSNVIKNLNFMNNTISNFEIYSSYLRFVHCPHLVFQKLFSYFPYFQFIPDEQQLAAYDEIYDVIMCTDKSFIKEGIIAFHTFQSILKYRPDLNMNVNFTDLIKLFGIQILWGISEHFLIFLERISQGADITTIISNFPDDVREGFYYLFCSTAYLPSGTMTIEQNPLALSSSYSMVQLITAITLQNDLIDKVHDTGAFNETFNSVSKATLDTLSQRRLRHAIYHLSDPSHPIYIRELIQNAIDACVEGSNKEIRAHSYQLSDNEHVFQITDTGKGMSLEEIFKYLILPEHSSKRGRGEFIGGRGVGLFTIFHDAKEVLIKTSKGDGETYYLQFLPQYDASHRIYDIHIKWYKTNESSKGTLIQRISNTQHLKLETIKAMNAIRHFGRFVPSENVEIYFNDIQINSYLTHLASVNIENFGLCKIYQHSEAIFTANGLFIKYIDDVYWQDMPPIIKNIIQKYGILIDLPPKVSLTRERSDFQSADEFQRFFKPLFACLCLQAYCRLLCSKELKFEELPDDIFDYLEGSYQPICANDPVIARDAETINNGGQPSSFTYYFNQDRFISLLLHLSFIPYRDSSKTFSIIELAGLIGKTKIDIDRLPYFIQKRIKAHSDSLEAKNNFKPVINELVNDRFQQHEIMKPWRLSEDPPSNWLVFNTILESLCVHFEKHYQLKLNIQYSAENSDARAFVKPWDFTVYNGIRVYDIYFNPFQFEATLAKAFTDQQVRETLINELLGTLSHEVTHLLENSSCCGSRYTHNNEFRDLNADIYSAVLFEVNVDKLSELFKEKDNDLSCSATLFLKNSIYDTPNLNKKHHFFN